jgi:hypothetical protein
MAEVAEPCGLKSGCAMGGLTTSTTGTLVACEGDDLRLGNDDYYAGNRGGRPRRGGSATVEDPPRADFQQPHYRWVTLATGRTQGGRRLRTTALPGR